MGKNLGLKEEILGRHPFPGPGLAIRIIGDVTPAKVAILQKADEIYIRNLKESNLYHEIWQAGSVLLPVKSVGVMGMKEPMKMYWLYEQSTPSMV